MKELQELIDFVMAEHKKAIKRCKEYNGEDLETHNLYFGKSWAFLCVFEKAQLLLSSQQSKELPPQLHKGCVSGSLEETTDCGRDGVKITCTCCGAIKRTIPNFR